MTNVSMKYNGSGYYDETPYKATMQMAKAGEIWTSDTGKEFLILKNHGTLCTVLHLLNRVPRNSTDSIEVLTEMPRWTNMRTSKPRAQGIPSTKTTARPVSVWATASSAVRAVWTSALYTVRRSSRAMSLGGGASRRAVSGVRT